VKRLYQASLSGLGIFTTQEVKETGKWIVFVDPETLLKLHKCHQKSLIKQEKNSKVRRESYNYKKRRLNLVLNKIN